MAGTTSLTRTTTPTLTFGMNTAKSYAAKYKEKQREEAKLSGICIRCLAQKAILSRTCCTTCHMKTLIQESFKFDRDRKKPHSSSARGSCYVDQFNTSARKKIISDIIAKFDGTCHYTGIPIEIGLTASLVFKLPKTHVSMYGADAIYAASNVVWCHKGVSALKSNKTDADFRKWLVDSLLQKLISDQIHANHS